MLRISFSIDTSTDPDSLKNVWGGPITAGTNAAILPAVGTSPAVPINGAFWVAYEDLPTAACVRLTSTDASGSGRVGSGIRSINFKLPTAGTFTGAEIPPGSLDPDDVATAALCGQVGGVVDVRFYFTR